MKGAWWVVVAAVVAGCVGSDVPITANDAVSGAPHPTAAPEAAPKVDLGSIRVTVVTAEIEAIPDAEVVVSDTPFAAFTDAAGLAVFNDVDPGTYTVLAAKPGYQPVQDKGRIVEVVAGEVADVRLTLDPVVVISANNSYSKTLQFRGFISCSFHITLVGYTSHCGRGLNVGGQEIGRDPNDNSTHLWQIDGPQVQGVILEAQWTPSNAALGSELQILTGHTYSCDAYHCSPGGFFESAAGKSPLKAVRIEGEKQNLSKTFTLDAKYPKPVWSEARAYLCTGCTHDILVNQRYDMFASAFYGREPEPDFTALPKN